MARPRLQVGIFPRRLARPLFVVLAALALLGMALAVGSCGGKDRAAQKVVAQLQGPWESVDRSDAGIGSTLMFGKDLSASFMIGAMVNGRYSVEQDSLTVSLGDSASGGEQTRVTIFRVAGDTLRVFSREQVPLQILLRVGRPTTETTLAGTWTYNHPAGIPAYEIYTPQGRFMFRLPMRSADGTFAVVGDSLQINLVDNPAYHTAYGFDGEHLVLTDATGRASRYARADAAVAPLPKPPAMPRPAPAPAAPETGQAGGPTGE